MKRSFIAILFLLFTISTAIADVTPPGVDIKLCPGNNSVIGLDVLTNNQKLDVVFVIDDTGSMGNEINSIKAGAVTLMTDLQAVSDAHFGVVSFDDPAWRTVFHHDLSGDTTSVSTALNLIVASGGGDCPEYAISGLSVAANDMSWRPNSQRIIFLITDAGVKDANDPEDNLTDTIALMNIQGITANVLVHLSGCPNTNSIFQQIADDTGGELVTGLTHLDDPVDTMQDMLDTQTGTATVVPVPQACGPLIIGIVPSEVTVQRGDPASFVMTISAPSTPFSTVVCAVEMQEENGLMFDTLPIRVEIADLDADGKCDDVDNCPTVANADQADADIDGIGDACDTCPNDAANDADGDGVCGDVDNCPTVANADQLDSDGDGTGDACDPCPFDADDDIDGDGVCGDVDNCPTVANADQTDTDGDGIGDVCDSDDDNDGVLDGPDIDPLDPTRCIDVDGDGCDDCAVGTDGFGPLPDNDTANDGTDTDSDGVCDTTDTDDDNDGVLDADDNDPLDPNVCRDVDNDGCDDCSSGTDDPGNDGTDTDGDGLCDAGDSCPNDADNDADGDGVCGDVDNCPTVANADQLDSDGDGAGDACDPCPFDADDDIDGDGVCGDVDNCPTDANADQADFDGDGIGDVCDPDDDNDGVNDEDDAYPNSDPSPTVGIGGTELDIPNRDIGGGATLADYVNTAEENCTDTSGADCMSESLNVLLDQGIISGKEKGKLQNAIAKTQGKGKGKGK